jgi:hypothetical protein
MLEKAVVAIGLPSSGKTTFLAALWHLIQARKIESKFILAALKAGEGPHLKAISARWLQAKKQERTFHTKNRTVTIALKTSEGVQFDLSFPDIAGEAFAEIWESRQCDPSVVESLRAPGVLLFLHSTNINSPHWIYEEGKLNKLMGSKRTPGAPVAWEARFAPTQVQLVDLLRCLQESPLDVGPRRLAIVLSAWDLAESEKKTPADYLAMQMPLLHQYLQHGLSKSWAHQIYGISAQGAEYDGDDKPPCDGAKLMREKNTPSERIKVLANDSVSHDLTEPLFWLLN